MATPSKRSGIKLNAVPFSSIPLKTTQSLSTTVPCTTVDNTTVDQCSCLSESSEDEICPLLAINIVEMQEVKVTSTDDSRRVKVKKQKRPLVVPNAFVALPIRSVSVIQQVEQLQNHMMEKEPKIKSSLIPLNKLHITLMVIKLDNEEEISRAQVALSQTSQFLQRQTLSLNFSGLSSFGSKVLYADVDDKVKEDLQYIASQVRSTFEVHGIPSTEKRQFTAHMTIAKLSRQRKKTLGKISQELYSDWSNEIGQENVEEIELLSMSKKDETGYYFCYARENFVKTK